MDGSVQKLSSMQARKEDGVLKALEHSLFVCAAFFDQIHPFLWIFVFDRIIGIGPFLCIFSVSSVYCNRAEMSL